MRNKLVSFCDEVGFFSHYLGHNKFQVDSRCLVLKKKKPVKVLKENGLRVFIVSEWGRLPKEDF